MPRQPDVPTMDRRHHLLAAPYRLPVGRVVDRRILAEKGRLQHVWLEIVKDDMSAKLNTIDP